MLDLKTLAATQCTKAITLRGSSVNVQPVTSRIQRKIESLLPYPKVTGDNPEQVAKYRASDRHQQDRRDIDFSRACLRAAYAAQLSLDGLTFGEDMTKDDAKRLAAAVADTLTDLEVSQIHEASYEALVATVDPKTAIGTEAKPGN